MNVLKIIGKVLLTILRVPFTIWYVVIGLFFKLLQLINRSMRFLTKLFKLKNNNYYLEGKDSNVMLLFTAIITFEWASLTKFYHFKFCME